MVDEATETTAQHRTIQFMNSDRLPCSASTAQCYYRVQGSETQCSTVEYVIVHCSGSNSISNSRIAETAWQRCGIIIPPLTVADFMNIISHTAQTRGRRRIVEAVLCQLQPELHLKKVDSCNRTTTLEILHMARKPCWHYSSDA